MPAVPQRIASAFAVLCGRYGDVTGMAERRDRSRQSLYREAEKVVEAVDGVGVEARIDGLQRDLAERHAEVQALQEQLGLAREISPEERAGFAVVAQAEGVSLGVARRLLQVVAGTGSTPSVATPGRATLEAGKGAGVLLRVLDEAARPEVRQVAADEIFWAQARPDGRRAREPLLDDRPDRRGPRRPDPGGGIRPAPGPPGRGPRRRHRPG